MLENKNNNISLKNELIERELEEIKILLYTGSENIEETQETLNNKINQIIENNNYKIEEKINIFEQIGDLLFGIGNYETGMQLYNYISNLIENPLEEVELYRKKINFLLAYINYEDNYNKDIFDNIKNETKEKILKNTIKEISTGELNFNLGLVEEKQNNKAEALKYFKVSAYEDYEYGVYKYLEELEDDFLEKYNKLKSNEEKQDFLDKNLEKFEEEYYKFIDGIKDKDGSIIKKGDKELYGNIGEFYEKIGFYSDALSAYIDGTSKAKKGYIFYSKIANLYLNDKINLKVLSKSNLEIAEENLNLLLNFSKLANDKENILIALELLGDLKVKQNNLKLAENYYINVLDIDFGKNSNLSEKIIQKIIKISKDKDIINKGLENLLNLNPENLLIVADYYEQKGNIEYAFWNYLAAITLKYENGNRIVKEAINAMIFFIETTLKEKIINDSIIIDENIKDEQKEILSDTKLFELEIKKEVLKKITKEIEEKNDINIENIKTLFEIIIDQDFFDEQKYLEKLHQYIYLYNKKIENSNIALSTIIENLFLLEGIDNKIKDKLIEKIMNFEELNESDYKIIFF